MHIQSSPEQSQDAFLAVPYRDHWFWIDDLDMLSKHTFSFAMFLYSLAQTGRGQREPVLTVPTGT